MLHVPDSELGTKLSQAGQVFLRQECHDLTGGDLTRLTESPRFEHHPAVLRKQDDLPSVGSGALVGVVHAGSVTQARRKTEIGLSAEPAPGCQLDLENCLYGDPRSG